MSKKVVLKLVLYFEQQTKCLSYSTFYDWVLKFFSVYIRLILDINFYLKPVTEVLTIVLKFSNNLFYSICQYQKLINISNTTPYSF